MSFVILIIFPGTARHIFFLFLYILLYFNFKEFNFGSLSERRDLFALWALDEIEVVSMFEDGWVAGEAAETFGLGGYFVVGYLPFDHVLEGLDEFFGGDVCEFSYLEVDFFNGRVVLFCKFFCVLYDIFCDDGFVHGFFGCLDVFKGFVGFVYKEGSFG
mgnify:CR=1 FL=1